MLIKNVSPYLIGYKESSLLLFVCLFVCLHLIALGYPTLATSD